MNVWMRLACFITAAVVASCGSAAGPGGPQPAGSTGATPTPTVAAASAAPAGSVCPTATPLPARTVLSLPTPVAAFTGTTGGSKTFAIVESVDMAAQQITVTFSNSSTGGLPSGAPRTLRATIRVTGASVLQQVAALPVAVTAAVLSGETRIPIGSGAPAVAAKTKVFVTGIDECGRATTPQSDALAESAPAGSAEWVLATPTTQALMRGSAIVVAQIRPLQLSELRPGDVIAGTSGPLLFGLVFSGAAPNLDLTRLLRACEDDPCPPMP